LQEDGDEDPSPVSLKDFEKLRVLKIAPVWVFGDPALKEAPYASFDNEEERGREERKFRTKFCERFPRGLEKLHVTFCEFIFPPSDSEEETEGEKEWLVGAFKHLLTNKSTYLPNLQTLTLQGKFVNFDKDRSGSASSPAVPKALKETVALAREVGIRKVISVNCIHPVTYSDIRELEERCWGIDEDVRWADRMIHNQRIKLEVLDF
jgi:hypothetical protein